jgi:iron(III) transport system ATP-binding protein
MRPEICADVVSALRAEGATAIIVTHDRIEALAVADRIAVMMNGSVMQYDDPVALYRTPASDQVAAFLGDFYVEDGVARDGFVTTATGSFATDESELSGEVEVVRQTPQLRVFPSRR